MEFLLSNDDREVVGFARTALHGSAGLGRLRDRDNEWSVWPSIAADGWFDAGPSGEIGLHVLAAIALEAGRVAAVDQFVNNGWLLPVLIGSVAEPSIRDRWLERLRARPGQVNGRGLGGGRVTANVFGGGAGYDLYTVETEAENVTITRTDHDSVALHALADLSFGVALPVPTDGPVAPEVIQIGLPDPSSVLRVARLLHAAGAVGLAREMMARTVEHVSTREQFGHPLARFQAVKHTCADAHAEAEIAWLAVLYAAVDTEDPQDSLDKATLLAARALRTAARVSSQFQGAMGFTWESDLHLLLKAALDAQLRFSDAGSAAARAGQVLVRA